MALVVTMDEFKKWLDKLTEGRLTNACFSWWSYIPSSIKSDKPLHIDCRGTQERHYNCTHVPDMGVPPAIDWLWWETMLHWLGFLPALKVRFLYNQIYTQPSMRTFGKCFLIRNMFPKLKHCVHMFNFQMSCEQWCRIVTTVEYNSKRGIQDSVPPVTRTAEEGSWDQGSCLPSHEIPKKLVICKELVLRTDIW